MEWTFVQMHGVPMLTHGEYALILTADELEQIVACSTFDKLEERLYQLASKNWSPTSARAALQAAFKADGREPFFQHEEIQRGARISIAAAPLSG